MPTTWNPSDAGSGITLTNNNLTVNLAGANTSIRSTTFKTTGKWYFECTTLWAASGTRITGIMLPTSSLSVLLGFDNKGYGIAYSGEWDVYFNSITTPYGGVGTVGATDVDTVGVCVDLDNNRLYATKDGTNIVGNPVALTGGHIISAGFWFAAAGGNSRSIMTNFGATSFAFGPPSGFTAWDTSPFTYQSFDVSMTSITRVVQTVGV